MLQINGRQGIRPLPLHQLDTGSLARFSPFCISSPAECSERRRRLIRSMSLMYTIDCEVGFEGSFFLGGRPLSAACRVGASSGGPTCISGNHHYTIHDRLALLPSDSRMSSKKMSYLPLGEATKAKLFFFGAKGVFTLAVCCVEWRSNLYLCKPSLHHIRSIGAAPGRFAYIIRKSHSYSSTERPTFSAKISQNRHVAKPTKCV